MFQLSINILNLFLLPPIAGAGTPSGRSGILPLAFTIFTMSGSAIWAAGTNNLTSLVSSTVRPP